MPPISLDPTLSQSALPLLSPEVCNPFVREVFGHLGYGHMLGSKGTPAQLDMEHLRLLLEELQDSVRQHQRFDEELLTQLRDVLREVHHSRGLPDLRIWTLPHREGRAYRVAVSTRYDVDKAIVNLPAIHALEQEFDLRSTVYLRPMGLFYGAREIRRYLEEMDGHEVALHGEFVTTAESHFKSEAAAAVREKELLSHLSGQEVEGVCMHGGELRTNTTPRTRDAIEAAGYRYETMYRNRYYLPLHLPQDGTVRKTLSIGQHFADITVPGRAEFPMQLRDSFLNHFHKAAAVGGVFVPVMHPLYFNIGNYLRYPENLWRLAAFLPVFASRILRIKAGRSYVNASD
jgi:hypothetical protein